MCDSNENEQGEYDNSLRNGDVRDKSALNLIETDENLDHIIRNAQQRSWLKCAVCNVPLSSRSSVQKHVQGKRHQMHIRRIAEKNSGSGTKLFCDICKVKTNSLKQLEDHLKSPKHKGRVELLQRRSEFKNNCLQIIFIGSFIFAIILELFYIMFLYLQSM